MQTILKRTKGFLDRNLGSSVMPFSSIVKLFMPILVDQALITVLGMINASMVSSCGEHAVSAVGMVDTLNMFFMNLFVAVCTGGTVAVAQYMGRREQKNAGKACAQSVLSTTLIALIISLCAIVFCNPILMLLFGKAEPAIMENARVYLTGCAISYPFYAVLQSVIGCLRGVNDSRAAMLLSVAHTGVYVLLNFVLINLFKLEVLGVSISIVVVRAIMAVLAVWYIIKLRPELQIKPGHFFKVEREMQRSIFYVGLPNGMEQVFFQGGKLLTQTFVVGMGTLSLTANTIAGSITSLYYIPGNALALLVVTVVGQCVGAGRPDEARRLLRNLIFTGMVLFAVTVALLIPMNPLLLRMFNASPEVGEYCRVLSYIIAVFMVLFWPGGWVSPAGLRGAGDAKFPLIIALITMWTFRVVLGYVLGVVLDYGIVGTWLAMCTEWVIRTVVFAIRMRGDKWLKHNVISQKTPDDEAAQAG